MGTIVAVCVGNGGVPKHPVAEAKVGPDGLEGDRHRYHLHGGRDRALCLLSVDEVRSLEADGVRVAGPGAFGENLLIDGLDFSALRAGDRLLVRADDTPIELELFDVREPCATLRRIDRRFPDLMLGRSGFMARVLGEGTLRAELAIERP
ncbi:MOSC domain-containing protein [Engelhardtia mirabilis]|uniref:MOSC domain-containing protein n=1 Tax=Engelhardtia mirabilis TaxID=2528011 RepID=UPI003AF375B7